MISRRQFLNYLGVSSASVALGACNNQPPAQRYNEDDIALLAAQRQNEALASGSGRFGEHRYAGYQGLAELPWFELDAQNKLVCVDESIPMSIDMHAHLGMSVLFKPELDLQASTEKVHHLLDCDRQPLCQLDLDIYVNGNFDHAALDKLESTILTQGLWGNEVSRTHTIENLVSEMNAMRIERAAILPIKLDLPFGDDQTEHWRSQIKQSVHQQRLLAGFSVHPKADDCIEQMREHAKSGLKLMKLHPTVQRFYPDDPKVMPLYEEAQSLGVSVFFHGGRAGIEPESSHRYAMPRHYRAALANFPKINFILGHAGARDVDAMLQLMLNHQNAWLGTHGQGVRKLDEIIDKTKARRILFGTDWPFYHIGSSLAKALIVTDLRSRQEARFALLRGNALELLQQMQA